MTSRTDFLGGYRIPPAQLFELRDGKVASLNTVDFLYKGRALVAGAPEAFAEVGSGHPLRRFIINAVRMRNAGFDQIICIVTSEPSAVDAWSKSLDPTGRVRFMSDANLEFARALDLVAPGKGDRSEHYLLTLRGGTIETARIEQLGAAGPDSKKHDDLILDS
jgi:glutaredoxin/glutathione-dependent peroxiredoxin